VVELLRRISDHEERARVLLAERELWRGEQRALRASREELREKVVRLEEEARLASSERELLLRGLSEARAEAGRHEATAREQAELRVRLGDEHATTVAALTRRVTELATELAGLRGLSARLVELERQGERLTELGRRHLELEQALATANERLREHEAGANRPAPGDDLTRIKGIGPTYDRALRAAGIKSFAEIANWTDDDVTRVAGVLRARPDRIRREDWIGSARRLLEGG
jgi:predicted flap endonuclease-1-like 5' DNA nuclease